MLNKKFLRSLTLMLSLSVTLIACANQGTPSSQAEYEAAAPLPSSELIMPPGLTAPETNSTYKMLYLESAPNSFQMNKLVDMSIVSGGTEKWLVFKNKNVNDVFPVIMSFLKNQNVGIKYSNINIGLIQTDWIDKNNVTKKGAMHEFLGWIGLVKDKNPLPSMYNFRVNLWQHGNDTQVFVTDYQMNEAIAINGKSTTWVSIPPNPQLELDFLIQLTAFVKFGPGIIEPANIANNEHYGAVIKDVVRDKLNDKTLILYDNFDQSWWRTSIALERVGLGIADRNRSLGELYVYPLQNEVVNKDPGSFKRLFGDDTTNVTMPKPKYTVKLVADGTYTNVTFGLYPGAVDKDFANNQKHYLESLTAQLK